MKVYFVFICIFFPAGPDMLPRYRGHAVRELLTVASAAKHALCSKVA